MNNTPKATANADGSEKIANTLENKAKLAKTSLVGPKASYNFSKEELEVVVKAVEILMQKTYGAPKAAVEAANKTGYSKK